MKKEYIRMVMAPAGVELSGAVLTGSKSEQAIKVEEVTVQPFEQGFHEGPSGTDDFKTINFD